MRSDERVCCVLCVCVLHLMWQASIKSAIVQCAHSRRARAHTASRSLNNKTSCCRILSIISIQFNKMFAFDHVICAGEDAKSTTWCCIVRSMPAIYWTKQQTNWMKKMNEKKNKCAQFSTFMRALRIERLHIFQWIVCTWGDSGRLRIDHSLSQRIIVNWNEPIVTRMLLSSINQN